jgi:trans-aconitate 2-methyltransferase
MGPARFQHPAGDNRRMPREWNAERYHAISNPMFAMAMPVLQRLPLRGDELVLDIGCGSGLVTEKLAQRLPSGRIVAIDLSMNMLVTAREHLRDRSLPVGYVLADAAALPVNGVADAIFSTATFHWVLDHDALFRSLFQALKPGGRLAAQCGGGPNIQRLHDRAATLMRTPEFVAFFERWRDPWEFADADVTRRRLQDAGFVSIDTSLEAAPVIHADPEAFGTYLTNIICRHHLAYLPTRALQQRFVEALTLLAADDPIPFELDYWRLNIEAVKPR